MKDEKSFMDLWASSSAVWGVRHGLGESLDRYFNLYEPATNAAHVKALFEIFGDEGASFMPDGHLSHRDILKLGNGHIKWNELSLKTFKDQVKENTYGFRQIVQLEPLKRFFHDIQLKDYARETLWKGNIRPFKDLLNGSKQNLFKNLFYTGGVGFIGYNIAKTGIQHYRYWEKQADGSINSQWNTAYQTSKAVFEKLIQSFSSWEAAGIGMAIGSALFPIGAIPVAGIILSALFATTAYKAIGKLFPSLAKPGPSKS